MKEFVPKFDSIDAARFEGSPMNVLNDNHDICRIYHTMRGWFLQHPDGGLVPLKIGDWIIQEPFFKIMPDKRFKALFEPMEDTSGTGKS